MNSSKTLQKPGLRRMSTLTMPSPNDNEKVSINFNLTKHKNRYNFRLKRKSRIESANFFSKLHFLFGFRIINFANSLKGRELVVEDLDEVGDDESCEKLESLFTATYLHFKGKGYQGGRLIGNLLLHIFKKDIYFQAVWQLIYAGAKISASYFLSQMLEYVQDPETTVQERYMQSLGLFVSFIIAFYAMHQFNFHLNYIFNKIKTGFMGMIFRKSTKLSHHALHIMSLGKIVNFNTNDLNNFERIHLLISLMIAPLVLLGGWGLLYYFWGLNSFVGIAYLLLLWPLQYKIAKSTVSKRAQKSKGTDERVEGIIEGIQGIQTIKYYNWDSNLIQKIKNIRSFELSKLKSFNYIESIGKALVYTSHWIASFLIYVVCTLRGDTLKGFLIFPTVYLMSNLKVLCGSNVLNGFIFVQELKLAARKISTIMDLSEIEERVDPTAPKKSDNSAEFENFSAFRVNSNLEYDVPKPSLNVDISLEGSEIYQPLLSNINLNIQRGDLVAIIGDSGAGKSSLLLSFTNEFAKTSGNLRFQGKFAYVAQENVFFPGPLRECIVFGKPWNEEFFWKVLEACCLKDEVKALPNREMTEIVEKGLNLSEGQRARVSLARAIYSDADIYLLDECLSNLSMKVAKSVFKNCIQGLLQDKTVIMATNLLNLAKYANQIVVMDQGKIVTKGSYEQLIQNDDGVNVKFISALKKLPKFEPKTTIVRGSRRFASHFAENFATITQSQIGRHDTKKDNPGTAISYFVSPDPDLGFYYEEEKIDEWKVNFKIYWKYLTTIFSGWGIIPAILLFVGTESISWLFTLFIAKWRFMEWTNNFSYIVIGSITAISLPLSLLKYLLYSNRALNASDKLHNKMLERVFKSPMKFFDRNPSGRIINRFTNDIGILDKFLISASLDILEGFVSFWVTLAALWTRQVEVFISFAILVGFCIIITKWSYKAIAQTRGLELAARSPMYSLFLVGVRGLGVIRAHGQMEDILQIFYKKADDYSKANFSYMTCVRLMSFIMDYLIELVVIGTFAVFLSTKDTPLSSGFFVNKLGNFPSTMQWILRDFIKLHLLMASAARVINYCQNSKNEKPEQAPKREIKPTKGKIEIHNAQMKYLEGNDLAVNKLSVSIKAGENIAIFSHQKGGVTSLIGLLTRLYELDKNATDDPYLKIDNINVKDMPLSLLRDTITVVPQISVLFKDTIRNNLDPWKQYTDDEIWDAIDFVGLKEVIEMQDRKLDTKISGGSYVFSLGQQQLLCLARGLLKKCKIFIQDEATSHLDFAGEQEIQKALTKRHQGKTCINITHRLVTISNCDKVLTVENGETVEFDDPYVLLVDKIGDTSITKKKGVFALAVINMGEKISTEIFNNAMERFYERHGMVQRQKKEPRVSSRRFELKFSSSDDDDNRDGRISKDCLPPSFCNSRDFSFHNSKNGRITSRSGLKSTRRRRKSQQVEEESCVDIPIETKRNIVVPKFWIKKVYQRRRSVSVDRF